MVLNRLLYERLKHAFGAVRVSNDDEAMEYTVALDPIFEKPRLDVLHGGEQYLVCCPFCHDTRFRLYVSYMYGQRDTFGRAMNFLAICYNEGCLSDFDHRRELHDTLTGYGESPAEFRVQRGRHVPEWEREIPWPGTVMALGRLRKNHPAVTYLAARGFDVDFLDRYYCTQFCTYSRYFLAENRLIIPIIYQGKMRGWQARYVGELPWKDSEKKKDLPPKYWTSPGAKKSHFLYNIDRAKKYKTGILVEGPTDVFAIGGPAMCVFGKSLSPIQEKLFLRHFSKHQALIIFDPDAYDEKETREAERALSAKMPGRVASLRMPNGYDPGRFGSAGRVALRQLIEHLAAAKGLKNVFEKR